LRDGRENGGEVVERKEGGKMVARWWRNRHEERKPNRLALTSQWHSPQACMKSRAACGALHIQTHIWKQEVRTCYRIELNT
jgi:hypothetical protein